MINKRSKYIEVNPRNIPLSNPQVIKDQAVLYLPDLSIPVDGYWPDRSGNGKKILAATTSTPNDSLIMPANDADIIAALRLSGLYSQFYTDNATPKKVVISEITAANQFNAIFFDALALKRFTLFATAISEDAIQQMYDFTFDGYLPVWQTSDRIELVVRGSGILKIDWGDGNSNDYILSDTDTTMSHIYSTLLGKSKNIRVHGARSLTRIISGHSDGRSDFGLSVTNLTGLTYLNWYGNNTGTGSVTNLTGLTYLNWYGNNTGTGSVTNLTGLTVLNWYGSNTGTGSVTNLTGLTYLNWYGSNTGTGSVTNLTGLTVLNWGGSNTSLKITRVNMLPNLCYFNLPTNNAYSSTEINQLLADFVANKDADKPRTERYINITAGVGTQPPSGQGLADRSLLASYRSPNNLTQYPLWTVVTR